MPGLYTCGTWVVKQGREDEFIAAWQELAEWTLEEVGGTSWARLVQNEEQPNVFMSFGPWTSHDAIDNWRSSDGFRDRVAKIRDLLDSFEPGTYVRRAGVDSSDD